MNTYEKLERHAFHASRKSLQAALQHSLEKWVANSLVTGLWDAYILGDTCALCQRFTDAYDEVICENCPLDECNSDNSPWRKCYEIFHGSRDLEEFRAAAKEMADHIRSKLVEHQKGDRK